MATAPLRDTSDCLALVIDGNATSRSILAGQLRDYGVGKVVQCSRVRDARNRLEHTTYDFVLCEQFFDETNESGQTLLDDLRRAHLLPFSTIFFMVTAEASYASVAEAAESALDGYLLKPFTPVALFDRLSLARLRKVHLAPIFDAMEAQDFELAATLCLQRFETQQPYWLYAARMGAELLLRLGRHDEARTLFEAVIAARALPWAKLGVARAQVESGQATRAIATLQGLIGQDASYADAYDVLGRAQVEVGNFAEAMETYRGASNLTPDSVGRLQKFGMMAFYMGEREAATKALSRAAILGMDSKLFDFQSIVLLAFAYFADTDRKGLERCGTDLARVLERHGDSARLQRFARVVLTLQQIQQRQFAKAVELVKQMAGETQLTDFDFEAACNLAGLLAVLAHTSIDLPEGASWLRQLGMRYANTRGLSELMANACQLHPPYADSVRDCLVQINGMAERAMGMSLSGDPTSAVRSLLLHSEETLNVKLLDMSQQVLLRHQARIHEPETLQTSIDHLRQRCGQAPARAVLGQDSERQPGGVTLRVRNRAAAQARAQEKAQSALQERTKPPAAMSTEKDPASALRLRPKGDRT
ncbi:response regulator [Curvibacter sp. RS43]|uniref:response regulator n=1 Tax=Curvibacter microcysteis TaxID=3026419 RepID=UPI00235ECAD6|nr:tetratricopeptide repeat protein [Curvibacter sp. RS43]MDD0810416.1 response regulator [Curvibacter sp. RS43]